MKKIFKRLGIGIGSLATIVAPTTSLAFASNSNEASESSINDLSSLALRLKNAIPKTPSNELIGKVRGSDFYKIHVKSFKAYDNKNINYWKIENNLELTNVLTDLAKTDSKIFSDQEKIDLTNVIINDYSAANIMSIFGFDLSKSNDYNEVKNSDQGKTGLILGWHAHEYDQNSDWVYDITGADVMLYYKSAVFVSNEFRNLYKDIYSYLNDDIPDNTLVNFYKKWNSHIDTLYNAISIDSSGDMSTIDENFKWIQKFDGAAPTSEDDAYKKILHSKVVSNFISADEAANKEKSYDSSGHREKYALQASLISETRGRLLSLGEKYLDTFKHSISPTSPFATKSVDFNQTNEIISDANFHSLMSFARILVRHSNKGSQDIEIRYRGNLFEENENFEAPSIYPGLLIRSGHDANSPFEGINGTAIDVPLYELGSSDSSKVSYLKLTLLPETIGPHPIVWINNENQVYNLPPLIADQKEIMRSDYAIYYAMRLVIDGNVVGPSLILYENDHDNDSALKNVVEHRAEGALQDFLFTLNATYSALNFEYGISNLIALAATGKNILGLIQSPGGQIVWSTGPTTPVIMTPDLHGSVITFGLAFNRNEHSEDWSIDKIEETDFSQLGNEVSKVFWSQIQDVWDKIKSPHDLSSDFKIEFKIKSIVFPEVRFNTYDDSGWDDTHSDNFRFDNAKLIYDFKVTQIIQ